LSALRSAGIDDEDETDAGLRRCRAKDEVVTVQSGGAGVPERFREASPDIDGFAVLLDFRRGVSTPGYRLLQSRYKLGGLPGFRWEDAFLLFWSSTAGLILRLILRSPGIWRRRWLAGIALYAVMEDEG
jgi:hypothetical protein